ncbi:MAG: hypothetical protein A2785_03700 [Candidatus Chisholmbacteria bacterium RIFCSPHIGHO2_01_FULL_49_18]|uniref:Ribbon-helix-helix protein CopG domain-containing protein n=2 Tax=Candidatus Chisholmiibacteriota TaxID=1817900 RepID=A0A1G1VN69_9BACT|nr:MAG: hypothetical protein A2785_03700 [Candidatus Chisholmbacteria bacterium RIFCSPHIGHO2_01_FULL_49_18]OGY19464.1 MAG: hypothetical protein A3A65_06160 [Candidatus Chisholmbacteria bacterium RIFCSPLOWO2_01_FULL_49_14]
MSTVKVSFTLPEETMRLFKRNVPKRKRSKFVARKLEEELKRKELLETIRKTKGVLKETGPEEWKTEKSTRTWIRKMREADLKESERQWNE